MKTGTGYDWDYNSDWIPCPSCDDMADPDYIEEHAECEICVIDNETEGVY